MERKINIDGKEILQYIERVDDEYGFITVTRVPAEDGSYYTHRSFSGWGRRVNHETGEPLSPSQEEIDAIENSAWVAYENMSEDEIRARCEEAIKVGVSGRRQS